MVPEGTEAYGKYIEESRDAPDRAALSVASLQHADGNPPISFGTPARFLALACFLRGAHASNTEVTKRGKYYVRVQHSTPRLCFLFVCPRFNACRVPGETEDRVRLYPPAGNHHVLVLRRNRFFVVHVTDAEGVPLSRRDIQSQLQAVIDLAGPRETETRPVGVLTAWGRPEWARARDQLLADGNTELLERAEAAALAVCLDDSAPLTKSEVARALWHGDGRNRHFDKSVQIVVFSNGKAGLVGEHSMMDGAPVRG